MHTLTDPRLFLWMTKETVYGILKRNKIAVDVSLMSHSRTYTLKYPEKQWISRRKRMFSLYLSRPVQSWNILPHLFT